VHVHLNDDRTSGQLLGARTVGAIAIAVHKRIDDAAATIFAGAIGTAE
jgi:hypothetical protein